MNNSHDVNRFNIALANISKTPVLTAGVLADSAALLAKEGCLALNTNRVGLWTTNDDAAILKSVAYYSSELGDCDVQDDFILENRQEYVKLLRSERLIVINDIQTPNVLSDIVDEYGPNICSLLDAPIRIDGKLVGVVCIEQDKNETYPVNRVWTTEEQNFASSLADFMALALARNERLQLMKRNETLMSNLPGMAYQCINNPPDFTFTYVSDGCNDLVGYTSEELTGNSALKFFDMVHPDDAETLANQNEVTLSVGLPLDTTFRIITKDGSVKWIWERSSVVEFTPEGQAYVLEGFYADITERKQLEDAEAASKFKSDFLAKMSHEIRTPLNAIMGFTELVLREDLSDVAADFIVAIKQAGENLLDIINDILDISRIESGQLEILTETYMLPSLINDVISIIKPRTLEAQLRLVVDVDSNMPCSFMGDAVRIRQIILNLLGNAVKYTDEGFVSFSVSGEVTDEEKFNLIIKIEDSGRGIKKEDLDKLFDEFSRFDVRLNRSNEGTGLGLAIANNFIKAMSGDIRVESDYGKGSVFTVTLPQKIADSRKLAEVNNTDKQKVLLFENRDICLNSLMRTLDELSVVYKSVASTDEFNSELKNGGYTFVFIAAELYELVKSETEALESDAEFVFVAEFGELLPVKDISVLTTPIYNVPVANILNNVSDDKAETVANKFKAEFTAPDARVLIVDDINTNLVVTKGLLLPYKMVVDLCSSGEEAIQMIEANRYDMVLMDHMMPEMDGIEATAKIRELQDSYYAKLPIIALTANAVTGTKEMFLDNGFNGFISKPIDTEKLNSILKKYIPVEKQVIIKEDLKAMVGADGADGGGSGSGGGADGGAGFDSGGATTDISIDGIDTAEGLSLTGGTLEGYLITLDAYYNDGIDMISKIRDALSEGDYNLLATYVHALKSASASIGAAELSRFSEELEMAALSGNTVFINEHINAFLDNLNALIERINAVLARLGKNSSESKSLSFDTKAISDNLSRLKKAFDEYDASVINELAKDLQHAMAMPVIGDSIGKILKCKISGEYDEAVALIDEVLGSKHLM